MNENDRILSTVDQCDLMDYIDDELAAILGGDFPGCHELSPAGSADSSSTAEPPRAEPDPPKPNDFSAVKNCDGAPVILDFESANRYSGESSRRGINADAVEALLERAGPESKGRRLRPASQTTYDHIMAERKRREQLSQCFIALSAIVPGLKKMDKTSVLGDTIKYLKHLQERVNSLEQQATIRTMESVVLVKKSQVVEEEQGSSDEKGWPDALPDIEARVCGKSVLLKVQCEKRKGVLVKVLAEVEKLDLMVVNTSVTQFGGIAIDITVIAEMDKEMKLSGKDIVKALRCALLAAAS